MKIKNSKDIYTSIKECNSLSDLIEFIELIVSNDFYFKDEKIKKGIIQRLKYLIQKTAIPMSITHLHNILFNKNIIRDPLSYEIYELYINCIISKWENDLNVLPFDDFSSITFILFLDVNLYLEIENSNFKNCCNRAVKKLIKYIAKIYDICPENRNLDDFISLYSYITYDMLCKSITECDYKILVPNNKNYITYPDRDNCEIVMRRIYKKIEEIFNYNDKKKEFINKISFLLMKTNNLSRSMYKISADYSKEHEGINYYIDFIYGSFINFPFDEQLEKISTPLKRIISNIMLVMRNDQLSFVHSSGNFSLEPFSGYQSSLIITDIIKIIFEFKSYIDSEKLTEINRIVNEICCKYNGELHDDLFALESIDFESMDTALEAYKKYSGKIQRGQNRVYNAYKKYKINEDKIDSQATKAIKFLKKMVFGDKRQELIEGKKFTPVSLIRKLLGGYVAFSIAPVITILALAVRFGLSKKTTARERKKLIMELETELQLLDEKIGDARSASDNKAKYALMRTRSEVNNAIKKLKFGIEADEKSKSSVKRVLNK